MPDPITAATPPPDHTWKEAVARAVLHVIQRTGNPAFTIHQIYDYTPHLQGQFPGNKHVREKTRQCLQKLVDADHLLIRTARGIYHLNTVSSELEVQTSAHTATSRTDIPVCPRPETPLVQTIFHAPYWERRHPCRLKPNPPCPAQPTRSGMN